MPIVVEPDHEVAQRLAAALPPGTRSRTVDSLDVLHRWLDQHREEYAVVLGCGLAWDAALSVTEELRVTRPTVSVVMVRERIDTETLTQAMHAGARDAVAADDEKALTRAVERAEEVHKALQGATGPRAGRVVTVFSPKGGVGKTTSAVNLALAIIDGGARTVCMVDLDLAFGDIAITVQLFPTHSIEHAVGSEQSIDAEMLDGLLTRHENGLAVLAAPSRPDTRERITPLLISRILRSLRETFDYVIVDTSPSFDDATLTALDETDECVIVATLDVPTLKNVKVALETMDTLNIARGHRHLMLNRADDQVGISVDKVESILSMPVTSQVASTFDIAAATNSGTPIVAGDPGHAASRAFTHLAHAVTGEQLGAGAEDGAEPGRGRGLFRRRRN